MAVTQAKMMAATEAVGVEMEKARAFGARAGGGVDLNL